MNRTLLPLLRVAKRVHSGCRAKLLTQLLKLQHLRQVFLRKFPIVNEVRRLHGKVSWMEWRFVILHGVLELLLHFSHLLLLLKLGGRLFR